MNKILFLVIGLLIISNILLWFHAIPTGDFKSSVFIYKGIFPKENSEHVKDLEFSFVHIDVDIHDSVKECLEFFVPRMIASGIIVMDDYNAPTCNGAKIAADDFCKLNQLVIEPTVQCQAVIRF